MKKKGFVYLVGAGPGDTGLMTLRGAEVMARADVVVYDALVNADLLRLAPREAEIIFGGKRAKCRSIPQGEKNQLLVEKACEGKIVVRLKGGDPYIFGRGAEEAEELAAAGIPFEVVPGVSSISAVPNYAGVPLTHRELSSGFTVITGHEHSDKPEDAVDWAQVAATPGTKVVMMATERMGEIARRLMAHGMPPKTPVAMVRWGTTGQQQSIDGTLATIGELVTRAGFRAPSVTVIGEVVRLRDRLNWFEKRPLFGQRVVVTRARDQAGDFARQFAELGAEVLEIPTIKIVPPEQKENLKDAMLALNEYDWIIFTSTNGVTEFFNYFFKAFDDMRDIGGPRIAAVGPSTAAKLREMHLKVDVMPKEYLASEIVRALTAYQSIENVRILLLRAEVANPDLPRELEKCGAIVDDVACYRTVPETEDISGAAARLIEAGADWVTFTSGSTVACFHERFNLPELKSKYPKMRLASIGPETSKAIRNLKLEPDVEAREHTTDGLVAALIKATKSKSKGA
ncbi:MAG: uroporphyrinogen-III C-methyltransferase [Pedosphaera sp.]|nr:uroporphyrinogen-III C-methyltransferase [Pedosphaera sp.]